MARLAGYSSYKYFAITSPGEFVAHVEINRPKKLNAFIEEMWLELRRVFEQLSTDPDVRVVVLSGAGNRAFTAGLDVQVASENGALKGQEGVDTARAAFKLKRYITEFPDCITAVEKCEKRKTTSGPCYWQNETNQLLDSTDNEQLSFASSMASP
jgi:Delta3,5-Delta2,4-dienoyl-CoA isomerase